MPSGSVHKGHALQRARLLLQCDLAIYVGDDDTDEDAFGASSTGTLLGIRIGVKRLSKARYHLKDQVEIDVLLHQLIKLRPLKHARKPR